MPATSTSCSTTAWLSKERDADGNLQGDPKRFPSGMKALGDYLHEQGLQVRHLQLRRHQDLCRLSRAATSTKRPDAKMYASWGVDYLKYDWCNTEHMDAEAAIQRHARRTARRRPADRVQHVRMGTKQAVDLGQGHRPPLAHDRRHCTDLGRQAEEGMGKPGHEAARIKTSALEKYAGPGHWNDPDMLEVGNKGLTRRPSRAPTSRSGACSPRR